MAKPLDIQKLLMEHMSARKEARRAAERGNELVAAGKRKAAMTELKKAEKALARAGEIERLTQPAPPVYDPERPRTRRWR
jgi:hypothetical protein